MGSGEYYYEPVSELLMYGADMKLMLVYSGWSCIGDDWFLWDPYGRVVIVIDSCELG